MSAAHQIVLGEPGWGDKGSFHSLVSGVYGSLACDDTGLNNSP